MFNIWSCLAGREGAAFSAGAALCGSIFTSRLHRPSSQEWCWCWSFTSSQVLCSYCTQKQIEMNGWLLVRLLLCGMRVGICHTTYNILRHPYEYQLLVSNHESPSAVFPLKSGSEHCCLSDDGKNSCLFQML